MHNLAVYMPYIQRESLQDMSWWSKTRKDVIKDVDSMCDEFPEFPLTIAT